MDYRQLLGKVEAMVLPYLGGLSVHAADRRLRVQACVAVGWWRFEVSGRVATPREEAEPADMRALPSVRGHLVGDWLFTGGTTAERVYLMPNESELFTPAKARRWHSGDHLFDDAAFADDPELAVREAWMSDTGSLAGIKGVAPSLRAAFGYAVARREANRIGMQVSAREVLSRAHEVAAGTLPALTLIRQVEARRYTIDPQSAHRFRGARRRRETDATLDNAEDRACAVLEPTGAEVLATRLLGERELEVAFRYRGERFIAVVDWETLHVYDSGICLSGADEELGLDSLPAVISEAIDTGELVITRRS